MAAPTCGTCPQLRQQIHVLNNHVHQLNRRVEFLRHRLAWVLAGIRAVCDFIDREQEHPTLPRRNFAPAIHTRLTYVVDTAEGKN